MHEGRASAARKVVVPGKSAESFLFLACSRQVKPIMPPKTEEPLTPQELIAHQAVDRRGREGADHDAR